MILIEIGNIIKAGTEAIVSAANGVGIMGRGVAGAISIAGGTSISKEAKDKCKSNGKPFEPGEVYSTGPGKLREKGIRKIYHAVTMKFPGGITSLYFINIVMKSIIEQAIRDKIKSIAIPGLGTGIGRLNKDSVALIMIKVAKDYDHLINICFVDYDENFIDILKELRKLDK